MTKLIVLIGLPGSGKSFLASALLAEFPGSQVISTDAIRARLFGHESIQGPWLLVWRQVERQFQQAVKFSCVAIYDATNVVRRNRLEAIALGRAVGFTEIIGLWVDAPLQLCLERNRKRDRIVPEAVILQMHVALRSAPPSLQDGLDRLLRYTPGAAPQEVRELRS